jgi:hypothetical protein
MLVNKLRTLRNRLSVESIEKSRMANDYDYFVSLCDKFYRIGVSPTTMITEVWNSELDDEDCLLMIAFISSKCITL